MQQRDRYNGLDEGTYAIVNIWTSGDNVHIPGHGCGHVSIETHGGKKGTEYFSLWPKIRDNVNTIKNHINWKVENRLAPQSLYQKAAFPVPDYETDCALEGNHTKRDSYNWLGRRPELGEMRVIRNPNVGNFQVLDENHNYNPEDAPNSDRHFIYTPYQANLRVVLFNIDVDQIRYKFKELRANDLKYRYAGSDNVLVNLTGNGCENCVTTWKKLMKAGGMYHNLPKFDDSEDSCNSCHVSTPDDIVQQVITAKVREIDRAVDTKDWRPINAQEISNDELLTLYDQVTPSKCVVM